MSINHGPVYPIKRPSIEWKLSPYFSVLYSSTIYGVDSLGILRANKTASFIIIFDVNCFNIRPFFYNSLNLTK